MPRVKRGKIKLKKRKKLLAEVKGYKWGRKSLTKLAKQAWMKAMVYAYRDRRRKKREFRKLWQQQINALCSQYGIKYNQFIFKLKKNNIELDRKILAQLTKEHPRTFEKIVEKIKNN